MEKKESECPHIFNKRYGVGINIVDTTKWWKDTQGILKYFKATKNTFNIHKLVHFLLLKVITKNCVVCNLIKLKFTNLPPLINLPWHWYHMVSWNTITLIHHKIFWNSIIQRYAATHLWTMLSSKILNNLGAGSLSLQQSLNVP